MGLKDLCMRMWMCNLDRGSVHDCVCHGVSVARIGFQHNPVKGGAARKDAGRYGWRSHIV